MPIFASSIHVLEMLVPYVLYKVCYQLCVAERRSSFGRAVVLRT